MDTESDGDDFDSTLITHSVVFKCVGVTKDNHLQEISAMAAQKLKKQEQVDVRLRKEPNNPKDSRAIAFECKLISKWERIGYVVKALDSVHHEMDMDWSTLGLLWLLGHFTKGLHLTLIKSMMATGVVIKSRSGFILFKNSKQIFLHP